MLAKELAREAKKKGICKEWHSELKGLRDKKAMIRMYLKGIDFCLANDYPDNEFIRKHFKGEMEELGVFLDDEIRVEDKRQVVCLGETHGQIAVSKFNVARIYVKHGSNLKIIAKDRAFVMVDVFDSAVVDVCASDKAKVCVNLYHGSRVTQSAEDEATIKVTEKQRKTY